MLVNKETNMILIIMWFQEFVFKMIVICLHTHTYIYIYKLATLVAGDPKSPFSKATTPRCRGGRYSFPWIAPLYP